MENGHISVNDINSANNAAVFSKYSNIYTQWHNNLDLPPNAFSNETVNTGTNKDVPVTAYKFTNEHFKNGDVIWYVDGSTNISQSIQMPVSDLLETYMPEGKYEIFATVRAGVSCQSKEGYTGVCGNSGCADNNGLTYMDMGFELESSFENYNLSSITKYNFSPQFCSPGVYNALTDFEEFRLGEITVGPSGNRYSQYIKFEAHSLKRDVYSMYTLIDGLSINGIRLVYHEEDNDNIPWYLDNCPNDNNPEQVDTDNDGIGDQCDPCPTDPRNALCNSGKEFQDCRTICYYNAGGWTVPRDVTFFSGTPNLYICWYSGEGITSRRDYELIMTNAYSNQPVPEIDLSHTYTTDGRKLIYLFVSIEPKNGNWWEVERTGTDKDITINCPADGAIAPIIDNISTDPINGMSVDFNVTNNTGGRVSKWNIDFGDGTPEQVREISPPLYINESTTCRQQLLVPGYYPYGCIKQNLIHTYSDCGIYKIKITAIGTDDGLSDFKEVTVNAFTSTIPPAPFLDSRINNIIEDTYATAKFYSFYDGEASFVEWTFGNGSKAYSQNATVQFKRGEKIAPVNYKVMTCGGVSTVNLTSDQIWPCPWIKIEKTSSTLNKETYRFSLVDNIGGYIDHGSWTIYKGSSEIAHQFYLPPDINFTYTFNRDIIPQTYEILGYPRNPNGSVITEKWLTVGPLPPVIDFTVDNSNGTAILKKAFTATNTGGRVDSWFWDFGDGETSTQQSPLHYYKKPGTYSVTLRAKGPEFEDVETKSDFIVVRPNLTPILMLLLD